MPNQMWLEDTIVEVLEMNRGFNLNNARDRNELSLKIASAIRDEG